MGKGYTKKFNTSTKFRRQSPELMRQRFLWLNQVLIDPELPASSFKVAYRISDGFNDQQSDGRAWEAVKNIADAIGMSKKTVITMVRRLHAKGHLRVDWGQQGRGHPNNYWLILKGASTHLSDEIKGASTPLKGAPTHLNQDTNEGSPYGTAERVSGCATASAGPAPSGHPRRLNGKDAHGHGMDDAACAGFEEACAAWPRPWADNRDADAHAYLKALQRADHAAILAGLKAHAAAADDPRFLQPMAKWLDARMWEKKPPTGKSDRRRGQSRRRGRGTLYEDLAAKIIRTREEELARRRGR